MRDLRTEVLVIGGGATGAGVVRDLSLRGVDCVLLEMGDYCHGASGGNHGLLHSGGRYAVKDPSSASECASENKVLKRIASFCIEDTGGFFVSLPGDDPDFAERFQKACQGSGVPVKEIDTEEVLAMEPGLNPGLVRCFEVPDGSVDPFALVQGNVDSARENGARVHNHCHVTNMLMEGRTVSRVEFVDARDGHRQTIVPEVVINAAGSWAPAIASMAGVRLMMALDQGSMLVADGRLCERVINRLRPPSNGDICVPNHTSTIVGTTSRPASTPEDAKVSAQDVELLVREGSALLPSYANARTVRAYCGVRPLLGAGGRDASRTFSVIREEGAENLLSVVGGKLTTYRLMAEKVSDQACSMLGTKGVCRTHLEELSPGAAPEGKGIALTRLHRKYGGRAAQISTADPRTICSCEQVLRSEVEHVLRSPDVMTMADIMRRTRAGMGYCQGLDCSFGILEMMVKERDVEAIATLTDFLAERERGQGQASGEQCRQELFRKHLLEGVYGLGGRR
ncbi:MAG: anaerobic glycerol-3-phosphate dehydrogenase subunit A [Methanomassiliicoccales archaeon]|nr:anaerobic glycerol-3-phosphate dehydrogenase subunit A [Methanomassiliicoccales archaeon]